MDEDTFLTTLYVMTDDYCKSQGVDWPVRPGPRPALSLAEVLTLALMSRGSRFRSDRDFDRYVRRHWAGAFPTWPHRGQLNRLTRASVSSLCGLSHWLAQQSQPMAPAYEVLDTLGCATRHDQRRANGWLAGEANIGYCNRLGWYEGLNVITSVTPQGVITGFGCAPASTQEQPFAETFLQARAQPQPALAEVGPPAVGLYWADNGFSGAQRQAHWRVVYGALVIFPPKRHQTKYPWPKALRRALASVRQIVETVHEKLLQACRFERERPHHLQGFRARLAASCALHNLCIAINLSLGRPPLAFAELVEW